MKTYDAIYDTIVIGAGLIGLSLALKLKQNGLTVLVVERTEPGREASHAAAGMIAHCDPDSEPLVWPLSNAAGKMFPAWVAELEAESGLKVDFRRDGVIDFIPEGEMPLFPSGSMETEPRPLTEEQLRELEPALAFRPNGYHLPENFVDPRLLLDAVLACAKKRGVDLVTGSPVVSVESEGGRATGVRTERSHYAAKNVVNCAGAWAEQIAPVKLPTHPVKGQVLCLVFPRGTPGAAHEPHPKVRHVVRAHGFCYIVPRSDGRLIVGSTREKVGFDKNVDVDVIQRLHQSAAILLPEIGEARILETWAGLRPGSPDELPIMGETELKGYFAATGHYCDGIMLAPVTAEIMGDVIEGREPKFDIGAFSPRRF